MTDTPTTATDMPAEAEQCIVCLSELRTSIDTDRSPGAPDAAAIEAASTSVGTIDGADKLKSNSDNTQSIKLEDDPETIAYLLPCQHYLHEVCLKPWVDRANSCPSCRTTFNEVHLSRYQGGPVEHTYAVQDKRQQAEIDPTMIVDEDELVDVETWEPCAVCGNIDEDQETMHCEGCDTRVHMYCSGMDEATEFYYCANCLQSLENDGVLPRLTRSGRHSRRPGTTSTRRGRRTDNEWDRVWDTVARRLDFDLDFPYDNDDTVETRTEEQRVESRRWQRRLQVASRQGSRNIARLRAVANPHIRQAAPTVIPNPESQDELRAWNAFDKARTLNTSTDESSARKRKATASPASPSEPRPAEQPQLKRPRLQRPRRTADGNAQAESSTTAAQRNGEGPSFLSSLLQEVERNPVSGAASSPAASEGANGQYSPANSSRARSPMSSGQATPRAMSVTPPPQGPSSPPLSSCVLPAYAYDVTKTYNQNIEKDKVERGRQAQQQSPPKRPRADSSSPSRDLPLNAKQDIQQMVKAALKPFHRASKINVEQYTDINRDVSRKLYALVSDASQLANSSEKEKLETTAGEEVAKMVASINKGTNEVGSAA